MDSARAMREEGVVPETSTPAARLEAIVRSADAANDPVTIAELAADASTWTGAENATTRTDARLLCAEAYAGRLDHPELAIPLERAVASDAEAPFASRAFAAHALVDGDLDRDDLAQAKADATTYAALFEGKSLRRLHTFETRRALSWAAGAELAVALVFAVVAMAQRIRAGEGRMILWTNAAQGAGRAVAVAAFVAFGGGGLAYAYDASDPRPFFALGAALVLFAAIAGATRGPGSATRGTTAVRAIVGASAMVAAAFLLLRWIDASYLAGFGL